MKFLSNKSARKWAKNSADVPSLSPRRRMRGRRLEPKRSRFATETKWNPPTEAPRGMRGHCWRIIRREPDLYRNKTAARLRDIWEVRSACVTAGRHVAEQKKMNNSSNVHPKNSHLVNVKHNKFSFEHPLGPQCDSLFKMCWICAGILWLMQDLFPLWSLQ